MAKVLGKIVYANTNNSGKGSDICCGTTAGETSFGGDERYCQDEEKEPMAANPLNGKINPDMAEALQIPNAAKQWKMRKQEDGGDKSL